MFGISSFSAAPFSAIATSVHLGVATISAVATVTAVTSGLPVTSTASISE